MGLFGKKVKRDSNGYIDVEVKPLITWDEPNGEGCIVSDRITRDGFKVGYMVREDPLSGQPDSGWRFYSGDEDQAYSNDPRNHAVFALNTICNYDPDIIPFLHSPVGSAFIRTGRDSIVPDDGTGTIKVFKQ